MVDSRAAVLYRPGDLRVEPREAPVPKDREVLVEVRAVGVCGSDVHYYEHGRIGNFVVRAPLVLGHESSGVVVERGPGATKREIGQRVAMEPGVPCLSCRECRTGHYNLCADVRFFATPPIDGAFASYVAIHEDFAFPIPDEMSDEAGALIEPLSVGLWACRKAEIGPGDRVLVTGAGPIGLLAGLAARVAGAAETVITDVSPDRLETASRLGFDRAITPHTLSESGFEADAVLECSGSPEAVRQGVLSARPAGSVVLVGMNPEPEFAVPVEAVQRRELRFTGTFRYANTYPAAISLVASGRIDLDALVTGRFPLQKTEAALRAGRNDPTSVKAVVHPGR